LNIGQIPIGHSAKLFLSKSLGIAGRDAAFPKLWSVSIAAGELSVYRSPSGKTYAEALSLRPGEMVSPVAFQDVTFRVDEILQ
jgi:hypothetical protein